MTNSFKQRVNRILMGGVTQLLKMAGFNKRRLVYVARRQDLYWIIDIQKSPLSTRDSAEFALNGGVYVPGVFSKYSGWPDPPKPSLPCCSIAVRSGSLTDKRLDKWWRLCATDEISSTDSEIAEDVRHHVGDLLLPFLSRFESQKVVADYLSNPISADNRIVTPKAESIRFAYSAIIYRSLGDTDKASQMIEAAYKKALRSPVEDIIGALRQSLSS